MTKYRENMTNEETAGLMAMYHSEPNRSEPSSFMWFSVETPQVFREIRLPVPSSGWTKAQQRQFDFLEDLAERHGTHVRRSDYRRG